MLERLKFETRDEWLAGREAIHGIGGSEAAAAIGLSKWKSPVELWQEKTGRRKPKGLSGVEYVEMGVRAEGPLRDLFAALHPEYAVLHRPFDILYQTERPWMFATLDGEITDKASGDKGVLEIKKFEIQKANDWKDWKDQIPPYYFCQVLHQLNSTGWDFAYLFALLLKHDGNGEIRQYYFPREAYEDDLTALAEGETGFMGYVTSGKIPPAPILL